jgi:UrcA family protein
MTQKFPAMTLALAACGLAALTAPSSSQPAAAKSELHETITVYAPFVVRRAAVRPSPLKHGAAEVISMDRQVSFADLDLTRSADQATLKARVNQAAQDACKELNRRFPKNIYIPVPENQDCVGNATKDAMQVVDEVILAANTSLK